VKQKSSDKEKEESLQAESSSPVLVQSVSSEPGSGLHKGRDAMSSELSEIISGVCQTPLQENIAKPTWK